MLRKVVDAFIPALVHPEGGTGMVSQLEIFSDQASVQRKFRDAAVIVEGDRAENFEKFGIRGRRRRPGGSCGKKRPTVLSGRLAFSFLLPQRL